MIGIKNMKMPQDCPMCPMSHWNKLDEFTGCEVVGGKKFEMHQNEEYAKSSTRPSWCPLIDLGQTAIPIKKIEKFVDVITKSALKNHEAKSFYRGVRYAMTKLHVWAAHYPDIKSEDLITPVPDWLTLTPDNIPVIFIESLIWKTSGAESAYYRRLLQKWRDHGSN